MSNESYKSFISLIEEIDAEERAQRDRGTLFELLVATYLSNEPAYDRLFDNVWMLSDVPEEYHIPKKDTGVDLVAKKRGTDELVAIQCKYYDEDTKIRKEHIDSFLNEMGKSYYTEGLIITTAKEWSENANEAIQNRDKHIMRISLHQLQESRIDWSQFSFKQPEQVTLKERKEPLNHQQPAISNVVEGFRHDDRGKLIMAPGTGKTFTSLAITEDMVKESNDTMKVLYLVPSIQLLSQTLREWNADTDLSMSTIAVCSDRKVTKSKVGTEVEDIATTDIGFPPTTNAETLLKTQEQINQQNKVTECIVVFSTYQSIDVISEAQKEGFYDFDLMICDEAHRTTGATAPGEEESFFTKVHYDDYVKANKRLYQTATPRVYGDNAKQKAEEKSVVVADMNDSNLYGEEFYHIGFGDAIQKGILTDYKVMVLGVDEEVITRRFQNMLADENELQFDDVTKIIGCWNGLVKRKGNTNQTLGPPMKRALAFTSTIKESKKITDMFSTVVDEYLKESEDPNPFSIDIEHADGSMDAVEKNAKIDWLKSDVPDNTCRVLSNARFLTEGIDVPDLDAVMFLQPKRSQIDVAQAVGRVMRKAEGKDYGYIILPIGVPGGAEAHSVLDKNEKYQVVWDILNALRSIDERFDATINKLELNNKKPNQIGVDKHGEAPDGEMEQEDINEQLEADLSEERLSDLEHTIYGKIVKKVGNTKYWEQWSEDVAEIARKHTMRINAMLEDKNSDTYKEFQKFMASIRHNINDSISEQEAIEMLSQHLITKPIFEALFDSDSFANNNPVSQSMESILSVLDKQGLLKEQEHLEQFYESVRTRAKDIDNLEAKQKIIIQLYERFFKIGFKDTTDRLGIVFTPVEIVDFIIHSVEHVLNSQFGKSISDEGVHILDPFTGTGTFIVRLLQSGLISKEDLLRKYTQEIHANEIVLLSYYIAAVNIEETFRSIYEGEYVPFQGIVLTDTFESAEKEDSFEDELFGENNERLAKQQQNPVFAIIGNPPYSVGQNSANDNAQNQKYENLDARIAETYVSNSITTMNKANYDAYIKAFRWSTDRLDPAYGGIIAFVSNGAWLDGNTTSGFRKTLEKEFSSIWVFNLRGNQRTSGETSRKEGGKIFGSGSRTPISITILVKNPYDKESKATIHYYDIGDYLSRGEKLDIIRNYGSIGNSDIGWKTLSPNTYGDWINQRSEKFKKFIPISDKKNPESSFFRINSNGIVTNRDAWVYNSSYTKLVSNMKQMISFYNSEVERFKQAKETNPDLQAKNFVSKDPTKIKWVQNLYRDAQNGLNLNFDKNEIIHSMYRPFFKQYLYKQRNFVWSPYLQNKLFPTPKADNLVIITSGVSASKGFSVLITNSMPNLDLLEKLQSFPLYYYEKNDENSYDLFDDNIDNKEFIRKDGLTDFVLDQARDKYKADIHKKDLFYYVYGILHSPEYRNSFKYDLKKMLPRIPLVNNINDFWEFSQVGYQLAKLHLDYENAPMYEEVQIIGEDTNNFSVNKMKFAKTKIKVDGKTKTVKDKNKIIYNDHITITNIPEKAYQYVINGRSAIEWVMENYQKKTDKKSGIVNDPNDWAVENDNTRYILELLLRIIYVSVETVNLMNRLPSLDIDK